MTQTGITLTGPLRGVFRDECATCARSGEEVYGRGHGEGCSTRRQLARDIEFELRRKIPAGHIQIRAVAGLQHIAAEVTNVSEMRSLSYAERLPLLPIDYPAFIDRFKSALGAFA